MEENVTKYLPEIRKTIPNYHENCNSTIWHSHVEVVYEKDRKSLEGFNAFLKAIAERNDFEKKMLGNGISTQGLCDFNSTEHLYCDKTPNYTRCECGGKWQKLQTELDRFNGTYQCVARLHTKCRAKGDSPFKQLKGWSPCAVGSFCQTNNNTIDVILQKVPKYGFCVCDPSYDGKKKVPENIWAMFLIIS
jgi:hypothetical protein